MFGSTWGNTETLPRVRTCSTGIATLDISKFNLLYLSSENISPNPGSYDPRIESRSSVGSYIHLFIVPLYPDLICNSNESTRNAKHQCTSLTGFILTPLEEASVLTKLWLRYVEESA
jgi:hypothetical protein